MDEWVFVPEETTEWRQKTTMTPEIIQELNTRRKAVYRRLLLLPDPDSIAFQDKHYRSAFTNHPTKIWSGEPGVLIIRAPPDPPAPDTEHKQLLADFSALRTLWLDFKSPCLEENCPICQNKSDEKQEKEVDTEDDDDDDDDNNNEDDGKDDRKDDGKDVRSEDGDSDWSEESSEEDDKEGGEKDVSSSKKSGKKSSKKQSNNIGQQSLLQYVSNHRKNLRETERRWMNSAPYDESVPYTHRKGYTWAGTTSNELMELWQLSRKPVNDNSSLGGHGKEL